MATDGAARRHGCSIFRHRLPEPSWVAGHLMLLSGNVIADGLFTTMARVFQADPTFHSNGGRNRWTMPARSEPWILTPNVPLTVMRLIMGGLQATTEHCFLTQAAWLSG